MAFLSAEAFPPPLSWAEPQAEVPRCTWTPLHRWMKRFSQKMQEEEKERERERERGRANGSELAKEKSRKREEGQRRRKRREGLLPSQGEQRTSNYLPRERGFRLVGGEGEEGRGTGKEGEEERERREASEFSFSGNVPTRDAWSCKCDTGFVTTMSTSAND